VNFLQKKASSQKGKMKAKLRYEIGFKTALALSFFLVLLGAAVLRLSSVIQPFFQGEILHATSILSAQHLKDFQEGLASQLQPMFEYALRKVLWFPLLGNHERSLRLPNLFYSLLLVSLGFWLTYFYFLKQIKARRELALLYATLIGCSVAIFTSEIYLISIGRHYSLISALSLIFCWQILSVEHPSFKRAVIAALFLANTAFFSFSLIVGAFAWLALEAFFEKKYKRMFQWMAAAVLVPLISIKLNAVAWYSMNHSTDSQLRPIATALSEGFSLWLRFLQLHGKSYVFSLAVWVIVFARIRNVKYLRLVFLTGVVVPAFLVLAKAKSSYPFSDRYFSSFIGLQIMALFLVLEGMLYFWRTAVSAHLRKHRVVQTIALVILAIAFGVPTLAIEAGRTKTPRISPNFSPLYRAYRELLELDHSILVIEGCYSLSIPEYYLRYTSKTAFERASVIVDFCTLEPKVVTAKINSFLDKEPNGLVVFDINQRKCDFREFNLPGTKVSIRKTRSGDECIWIARGVSSRREIERIKSAVGFPKGALGAVN